jgi:hypothetical protein
MRARARSIAALVALIALVLVVAACGTGGDAPAGGGDAPAPDATSGAAETGGTGQQGRPDEADLAATWLTAQLRDVRSGEMFRIADLAGSLVVIEPMAIWCTSCARQQREASLALAELDRPDVVYVSLGVDPTEPEEDLAAYAEQNGFDWRFAVAPRPVARSLAETFGDQVLSPPSTPAILVTPEGDVVGPTFGIRSSADLQAEMLEHLP